MGTPQPAYPLISQKVGRCFPYLPLNKEVMNVHA